MPNSKEHTQTDLCRAAGNHNKKILLVSFFCPTRAHAGGLRILDIYKMIREHMSQVQLDILTFFHPNVDWSIDELSTIFDNVYLAQGQVLNLQALHDCGAPSTHYDVVDLQFHESGCQIGDFRKIAGKVIFTPMESMPKAALLSLRTNYFSLNKRQILTNINIMIRAYQEIRIAMQADQVVCVSESDAAFLSKLWFLSNVVGVDTGISTIEFSEALKPGYVGRPAVKRRRNVLYIAYFGSATNRDSLKWYLDHVHEKIRAAVSDYVFTIVGRGDLAEFAHYQDASIEFVGEVDDLVPYAEQAGVGIAPALSGSGIRGKVNQYAVVGVPSVVTPIAHMGLAYRDGEDILIADQPDIFAAHCIALLSDHALNDRIGMAARARCLDAYTWGSKWPAIQDIYTLNVEAQK